MKKSPPNGPERPVQMAVIGAPHGIRGELRVKTFTGDPEALGDYGPLFAEDGRRFTVVNLRPAGEVVVVRFGEVADRSQAEALRGTALFVDRSALPDELEEDEFYHADLIGLTVIDEQGERIGSVAAIHNFGAGDIVEVRRGAGGAVLIPFTRAAVPRVSVRDGEVRIDREAAGLTEGGEEGDEGTAPGEGPSR